MNYVLFDDETRDNLLPLVFFRPVCDLRIGILTIREKWQKYLGQKVIVHTQNYLRLKYPMVAPPAGEAEIWINGVVCPSAELLNELNELQLGQSLWKDRKLVGFRTESGSKQSVSNPLFHPESLPNPDAISRNPILQSTIKFTQASPLIIYHTYDLFIHNERAIVEDFVLVTKGRKSIGISTTNTVIGNHPVFVEAGAKVECAVLNATAGPIYIGQDAEIMEGSMVRGPFVLGEHSTLKMGAKIYGATTIGPHCKIGGEVNNSVVFGYSNKAHDGFLGNSVIAEWCNLGADTNNSNLKNNYSEVKLWNYQRHSFASTGLTFCGLIMGDHSKSGINTMFNTGTVVGVCCNVFGAGYLRNFIPDFAWGGPQGMSVYKVNDVFQVAERVMQRRNIELSVAEKAIIEYVFETTKHSRV